MESEVNGKLPFLDTTVTKQADGRLVTNVYRKPTDSDRYLHFSSHYPFHAKLAVIDTLLARGKAISQTPVDYQEEVRHITRALKKNGCPKKLIERRERRSSDQRTDEKKSVLTRTPPTNCSIPFVDGLTQAIQRVLRPLNICVVGTSPQWKWSLQKGIKDKHPSEKQPGVI